LAPLLDANAKKILKAQGKDPNKPTADEYAEAVKQAE